MKKIYNKFLEVMNTKNVGVLDRTLRILAGVTLMVIAAINYTSLALAIPLGILGLNVAMTGIRGVCSIYYMLGYSTCPISNKPNPRLNKEAL